MVVTGIINNSMIVPEVIDNMKSPKEFLDFFGRSCNRPHTVDNWLGIDNEELYDKNMSNKNTKRRLKEGNWNKKSICYRFNNYGFRTNDDFDIENPESGNIFLGCSLTEGQGLNIEDVWSYKLNKLLGGTFYNLSQSGTGLDTQYRLFKAWAPFLKAKKAFTLGAFGLRREFLYGDEFLNVNSWNKKHISFFEKYLSCDNELIISYKRTFDAIKLVAIENNIEIYSPTQEIHNNAKIAAGQGIWARDLVHYGPDYHDYLVNNFDKWVRII